MPGSRWLRGARVGRRRGRWAGPGAGGGRSRGRRSGAVPGAGARRGGLPGGGPARGALCPPRPIHHSAGAKKQDNCQRRFCVVWDKPGGPFCFIGSRPNRARRGPGKLSHFPVRKRPPPPFALCFAKAAGRARGPHFSALLCESGVPGFRALLWESRPRALLRFALRKGPAGHTFPLCSGKVLWRAFALCSGKVAGRRFSALLWRSPSGVVGFRALLWRSPTGAVGFRALL